MSGSVHCWPLRIQKHSSLILQATSNPEQFENLTPCVCTMSSTTGHCHQIKVMVIKIFSRNVFPCFRKYVYHQSGKFREWRLRERRCQTKHFTPEKVKYVCWGVHLEDVRKGQLGLTFGYLKWVIKKNKSMLIACALKNTPNYSIKIEICLRKKLLLWILIG